MSVELKFDETGELKPEIAILEAGMYSCWERIKAVVFKSNWFRFCRLEEQLPRLVVTTVLLSFYKTKFEL